MAATKGCGLLTVPLEIRYKIYEVLESSGMGTKLTYRYQKARFGDITSTTFIKDTDFQFALPWLSLLLTCKAMAADVRSYMDSQSRINGKESRTYTLDILTPGSALRQVTWRKIPCEPSRVEHVVANIEFEKPHAKTWGCGGPMPIVRELYQTLNRLLHYGPAFHRKVPLETPLKLKSLVLNISKKCIEKEVSRESMHNNPFDHVRLLVERLNETGLLSGFIDRIIMLSDFDEIEMEYDINVVEEAVVPSFWDGYGFEWGTNVEPEAVEKADSQA
ncbi:hypothetical protein BX600DRAFT_511424 [Xylariales sp. PMI_506]|nr:hypothetical protein BX600DRAFT_511424 [Xylariales sp. PMI_506]